MLLSLFLFLLFSPMFFFLLTLFLSLFLSLLFLFLFLFLYPFPFSLLVSLSFSLLVSLSFSLLVSLSFSLSYSFSLLLSFSLFISSHLFFLLAELRSLSWGRSLLVSSLSRFFSSFTPSLFLVSLILLVPASRIGAFAVILSVSGPPSIILLAVLVPLISKPGVFGPFLLLLELLFLDNHLHHFLLFLLQ